MKKIFTLVLVIVGFTTFAQTYSGDLTLITQLAVDTFSYTIVDGNVNIDGNNIQNLQGLSRLRFCKSIGINNTKLITLNGLDSIKGYNNTRIDVELTYNFDLLEINALRNKRLGALKITGNANLQYIDFYNYPLSEATTYYIDGNRSLKSIAFNKLAISDSVNPLSISIESNDSLNTIKGFSIVNNNITNVVYQDITIGNCKMLNNIETLVSGINGYVKINNTIGIALTKLTNLDFLKNIKSCQILAISGNDALTNCCGISKLLKNNGVTGNISISNNPFACDNTNSIVINCDTVNTIITTSFIDNNNNLRFDNGDVVVNNQKIRLIKISSNNNDTLIKTSDFTNIQYFYTDTGKYVISCINDNSNFSIFQNNFQIQHTNYGNKDSINFIFVPLNTVNMDGAINMTARLVTRLGMVGSYYVTCRNRSYTRYSGIIKLRLDSRLNFTGASEPSTTIGDTIYFTINDLLPFDKKELFVDFIPNSTVQINDTLNSFINLNANGVEINLSDNQYTLKDIVRASYDPNNKEVDKNILSPTEIAQSSYLNYTIHFQNIGNDTAFNITIKDTLDNNLDWSTFQPITSSHSYQLTQTNSRYVLFNFENIKLVDSTRNERASHGFISYKIKPKNNLVIGNSILNKASIVFDVNAPIVTNTAKTVIIQTNAGRDTSICSGQSITLTAAGATTYVWSSGATTPSITVTPTNTTSYIVTGTVNGVSQKDTVIVTVKPLPTLNLGNDINLCTLSPVTLTAVGNATTWLWNTGESTKSISKNPTTTSIYIVTASLNGCAKKDTVVVNILMPNTKINPVLPNVCLGDSIQLNASGASNYLWNSGQTINSIIVKPNADSMIKLQGWNTYTNIEGGYNFAVVGYVDNIQHLLETWGIDATTTITPNINFSTLTQLAAYMNTIEPQANWYVSGLNIFALNPDVKYRSGSGLNYFVTSPTQASYTIRYSDKITFNAKCLSRDSVTVTVKPLPNVAFAKSINGMQVQLTAPSGNTSYNWSFGDATTNSILQNPLHNYTANGKYYITLTSTLNGCTAQKTDSVTITITAINNTISFVDKINIYPNPTNNIVKIELNAKKSSTFTLTIFSVDGKIITSKEYKNKMTINDAFDLINYSSGVYLLQLQSENEQATYQIMKK